MFAERPYQEQARNNVICDLNAGKNPLAIMATGTGKTHVVSHVADWFTSEDRGNVLFLAHRKELIKQAKKKLQEICLCPVHEEMAEKRTTPWQVLHSRQRCVVVASKDTMKGRRLDKWPEHAFGLIITDECFPAGTLVDGRPIETIQVGEAVSAYNTATGAVEQRKVKQLSAVSQRVCCESRQVIAKWFALSAIRFGRNADG